MNINTYNALEKPKSLRTGTLLFLFLFFSLQFFFVSAADALAVEKAKIGVLDFSVQGKDLKSLDTGRIIADWFIISLVKDERFEVVERSILKKIMDEQSLGMSGFVDEKTAAKAGRMLGVNAIITGTVIQWGDLIEVSARIIDVESAAIPAAESGKAETLENLRDTVDEISNRLIRQLASFVLNMQGDEKEAGKKGSRVSLANVQGLVGSEKVSFFRDLRVIGIFQKNGMVVNIDSEGSRQMLRGSDISRYDFAFPSGAYAAKELAGSNSTHGVYNIFYTPMVVASWKPIVKVLMANGIAEEQDGVYYLDMKKLLAMINDGKRWSDLRENNLYHVDKNILITSTDISTSNSAAMYLSIAGYVCNGNRMVETDKDIQNVMPLMKKIFLAQGSKAFSSKEPFEDYLVLGMGKSPLLMIYESQFFEVLFKSSTTDDMALLYPKPTIFVKGVYVPFSAIGKKLGRLLMNDVGLSHIASEYGYRIKNVKIFNEVMKERDLKLPGVLIDIINSPQRDVLDKMINMLSGDTQKKNTF